MFRNFFYNLFTVGAALDTAEAARRPLMKTHTQCFQIWQVSAKYCTILDFLAHCCAIYKYCTSELRIYVRTMSSTGYSLP